ncbi:MAG: DUF6435 family protein [Bacteriovoracaceae bacterium]|jgi:hypothetical protein|nr:DUF6435 family protein [Bacteriovoracaceae bacterium]
MFNFLKKDPIKKLEKEYAKLMEKAVFLQRNGDIAGYALISKQADNLAKKIDEFKRKSAS